MGLDMYAYTLKKALVSDTEQVDIDVGNIARKAAGFVPVSDKQFEAMTNQERDTYWALRDAAPEIAVNEKIYNPEFDYWRKFNHLHGWMEELYIRKGGQNIFNCRTVRLESVDLDHLEIDVMTNKLMPVAGFFFGSMDPITPDEINKVLDFVKKARTALQDGYAVFYDSWW